MIVTIVKDDGEDVLLCVLYKVGVVEYVVDDEDCSLDEMVNDDDGHDDGKGNAMLHARTRE